MLRYLWTIWMIQITGLDGRLMFTETGTSKLRLRRELVDTTPSEYILEDPHSTLIRRPQKLQIRSKDKVQKLKLKNEGEAIGHEQSDTNVYMERNFSFDNHSSLQNFSSSPLLDAHDESVSLFSVTKFGSNKNSTTKLEIEFIHDTFPERLKNTSTSVPVNRILNPITRDISNTKLETDAQNYVDTHVPSREGRHSVTIPKFYQDNSLSSPTEGANNTDSAVAKLIATRESIRSDSDTTLRTPSQSYESRETSKTRIEPNIFSIFNLSQKHRRDKLGFDVHQTLKFPIDRNPKIKTQNPVKSYESLDRGSKKQYEKNPVHSSITDQDTRNSNGRFTSSLKPENTINQTNSEFMTHDNNYNFSNRQKFREKPLDSIRKNRKSLRDNLTTEISKRENPVKISINSKSHERLYNEFSDTSSSKMIRGKVNRQLWNADKIEKYNIINSAPLVRSETNVITPITENKIKSISPFSQSHVVKETSTMDVVSDKTRSDEQIIFPYNEEKIKSTTTLSSVFDENLIPPLPQNWPESKMEDFWNRQDSSSKYEEVELEKNSEHAGSGEDLYPSNDTSEENISTRDLNKRMALRNDNVRLNSDDYTNYEVAGARFRDHRLPNKTEPIPTIKIASKADNKDDFDAYGREKISFITIPPGSHWHLWGGFASKRRVGPFFEFTSNSNVTRDVTQVYTAYWGSSKGENNVTGIWILRFGSGAALLTLIVTVAAQTFRFCQPLLSQRSVLTTNLATSLATAHVVFIFGIKATDGMWLCGVVSLFLHFLYLLTCNWILALSIRLLRSFLQKKPFHTAAYCIPVWIASLAVVVVSYGMNPSGYETQHFCWLSVERGMLFAFIGPVCTLLLVNAAVCIASQKFLLDAGAKSDPNDRNDLRAGVLLLPLHGVAWFLAVVALEDDISIALDCMSAIATACVGYFTLHLYVPSWELFLYEHLPCRVPSAVAKEKAQALQTVCDNAQLPLLETQPLPSTSNNNFTSTATNTTILLEEYQMQSLYLNSGRKEVY